MIKLQKIKAIYGRKVLVPPTEICYSSYFTIVRDWDPEDDSNHTMTINTTNFTELMKGDIVIMISTNGKVLMTKAVHKINKISDNYIEFKTLSSVFCLQKE